MKSRFPYLKFSQHSLSPSKNNSSYNLDLKSTLDYKQNSLSNKSESNLNATISLPFTAEPTLRDSIISKKTVASNSSFYYEELKKLEDIVESKELEIKISKCKNDREGWTKEFNIYNKILEDLAVCIKYKDARCGNVIIRALVGCRKAVNKVFSHKSKKAVVVVKNRRDIGIQVLDGNRFGFKGDVDEAEIETTISDLVQKLESLKSSKVSARLIEVLKSLDKMYTEVPMASETPDFYLFEPSTMVQEIEKNISIVHKDIITQLNKKHMPKHQLSIALQTDFKTVDHEKVVYQELCTQKEIELFNLTNTYKKLNLEYESLKELQTKEQQKYFKIEEQFNSLELAVRNAKLKEIKMTEVIDNLKSDIKVTARDSENYRKMYRRTHKTLKKTEDRVLKIFSTLETKAEELYQAQINHGIATERLEQIEKAYIEKTGGKFEFVDVSIEEIEKKYGIKRCTEELEDIKRMVEDMYAQVEEEEREINKIMDKAMEGISISSSRAEIIRKNVDGEPKIIIGNGNLTPRQANTLRTSIFEDTQRRDLQNPDSKSHSRTDRSDRLDKTERTERTERSAARLRLDQNSLLLPQDSSNTSSHSRRSENDRSNPDLTHSRTPRPSKSPHFSKFPSASKPPQPTKPSSRSNIKPDFLNGSPRIITQIPSPPDTSQSDLFKYENCLTQESDDYSLNHKSKNQASNTVIIIRNLDENEVYNLLSDSKQLSKSDVKSLSVWFNNCKKEFLESLPPTERAKFESFHALKKEFKQAKKWYNINFYSKAVQYDYRNPNAVYEDFQLLGSKNTLQISLGNKGLSSSFDSKLDSSHSKVKTIQDEIMDGESISVQNLIARVMQGHDLRCGVECLHLKRAMAIKAKYRGRPYPVRLKNIEYFNRFI